MKIAAIRLNPEGVSRTRLDLVCSKLKVNNIRPCFFKNELLKTANAYEAYSTDELMKICDIVIALGGDGTILHAAKAAAMYDKPVLGINSGHLGFMAGLEADELDLLENLNKGNYITDTRMMLQVDVISKNHDCSTYFCVNDAVISRGSLSRMIDVSVSFGAKTEMEYSCDGLIASTPTGSTAYALSAGGPVLDPSINSILITPVCAHSFFSRPLVLSPETVVSITTAVRLDGEAFLTTDGEQAFKLSNSDIVRIKRADDHFVKLIKIKKESFMDVLHNKMIEHK